MTRSRRHRDATRLRRGGGRVTIGPYSFLGRLKAAALDGDVCQLITVRTGP